MSASSDTPDRQLTTADLEELTSARAGTRWQPPTKMRSSAEGARMAASGRCRTFDWWPLLLLDCYKYGYLRYLILSSSSEECRK